MTPAVPDQTAAPFPYKERQVCKGKNAPTLFRHGRCRYISVPKEWTSVVVFQIAEEEADRIARLSEEDRLRLRREAKAFEKTVRNSGSVKRKKR